MFKQLNSTEMRFLKAKKELEEKKKKEISNYQKKEKRIRDGILPDLSKEDSEFRRYITSQISLIRFFSCKCGHSHLNHKSRMGECLVKTCARSCFQYKMDEFEIKIIIENKEDRKEDIKNDLFNLDYKMKEPKSKEFWKEVEIRLGVFR